MLDHLQWDHDNRQLVCDLEKGIDDFVFDIYEFSQNPSPHLIRNFREWIWEYSRNKTRQYRSIYYANNVDESNYSFMIETKLGNKIYFLSRKNFDNDYHVVMGNFYTRDLTFNIK